MIEKVYDLECESCGNTGKIRNVYDDLGNFECCQCSDTVYMIELEGHTLPICKKCDSVM
jgi:hypothetical protein